MSENDKHPSAMTDEERAALIASDPDAFDEERADAVTSGEPEGEGKAVGEDAPKPDDDDAKPVDQRAFNGVLAELRELRQSEREAKRELQELREKFAAPAEPERDFDAERAALKEKLENGDIDDDQYQEAKDALLVEQAELRAVARYEQQRQAQVRQQIEQQAQQQAQSWNQKIGAWVEQNQDFMANPIRADAVAGLIQKLGADPNVTDDDLLKQVESAAFDAFNWTAAATPAPNKHAGRNAADAAAAAAASAAPPAITGGVGNRVTASGIDLTSLKPGTFSSLPKADQERLLGEGALDD